MNTLWTWKRRLIAGWVGTVLLWGGCIGLLLGTYNRYNLYFDKWDTWALIFLVFICGVGVATLLHVLSRLSGGRSDRILSPWFYFWLILVLFNFRPDFRLTLVKVFPWLVPPVYYLIIWMLGLLLTGLGYAVRRFRNGAVRGWHALTYLWFLPLILLVQFATAHCWEDSSGCPSEQGFRLEGQGSPVVMIILDMIGYSDLFAADGTIRPQFPSLSAFSNTAMVYHWARSPGDETGRSLPGLLLQEEVSRLVLNSGKAGWISADHPESGSRPFSAFPNRLSERFRRMGYRQSIIGYYLPYKELMPGEFDEVFSHSYYGVPRAGIGRTEFGDALIQQIILFINESKDPLSALLKQVKLPDRLFGIYYRQLSAGVQSEALRFIRESLSPGDFVLIHQPVPHQPFVFDAAGGPGLYDPLDPAGYPGQLEYADVLFGELVEALRESGLWDDSWVLVFSDHGPHFRDYSGTQDGKRHVPLMIKTPGQAERIMVEAPLRLVGLDEVPGLFPTLEPAGETGAVAE